MRLPRRQREAEPREARGNRIEVVHQPAEMVDARDVFHFARAPGSADRQNVRVEMPAACARDEATARSGQKVVARHARDDRHPSPASGEKARVHRLAHRPRRGRSAVFSLLQPRGRSELGACLRLVGTRSHRIAWRLRRRQATTRQRPHLPRRTAPRRTGGNDRRGDRVRHLARGPGIRAAARRSLAEVRVTGDDPRRLARLRGGVGDAFTPPDPAWRRGVIGHATEIQLQGRAGLAAW